MANNTMSCIVPFSVFIATMMTQGNGEGPIEFLWADADNILTIRCGIVCHKMQCDPILRLITPEDGHILLLPQEGGMDSLFYNITVSNTSLNGSESDIILAEFSIDANRLLNRSIAICGGRFESALKVVENYYLEPFKVIFLHSIPPILYSEPPTIGTHFSIGHESIVTDSVGLVSVIIIQGFIMVALLIFVIVGFLYWNKRLPQCNNRVGIPEAVSIPEAISTSEAVAPKDQAEKKLRSILPDFICSRPTKNTHN